MKIFKHPIAAILLFLIVVSALGWWFLFARDPYNFTFDEAFCIGCAITDDEEAYIQSVDEQEKTGLLKTSSQYRTYSLEEIERAEEEHIVLFFKADWCPTCRLLDAHLRVSDVPEDVLILYVDFDASTSLRQKYGVTVQHTLVLLDRARNVEKKWVGSRTLENVLDNL